MLKIRSQHLGTLARQQAAGFVGRMVEHLREMFTTEVAALDDSQLHLFVEKVCQRAAQWGIREESHTERLVELFAAFEQLRRSPLPEWVNEIVEYPGRPGEQILGRLENRLLFGGRPDGS